MKTVLVISPSMYAAVERLFFELPEQGLLRMFGFLTPADVVTLAKTSRPLRAIVQFYMGQVWDFNAFFDIWFPGETERFRDLLEHTGAVVSGSQALQFFERTKYSDSDLDIFVRAGGFYPVITFLLGRGYSPFSPGPKPAKDLPYETPSVSLSTLTKTCIKNMQVDKRPIIAVYNYRKRVDGMDSHRSGSSFKVVQVIVVESDPVHHILYDFHSTAVMNFISAHEAVSIFAKLTLVDRVSYVTNPRMVLKVPTWIDKYKSRGFELVFDDTPGAQYSGRADRFIGDGECFRFRFPVPPLTPESSGVRDTIYGNLNKRFRFIVSSESPTWKHPSAAVAGFLTMTFT